MGALGALVRRGRRLEDAAADPATYNLPPLPSNISFFANPGRRRLPDEPRYACQDYGGAFAQVAGKRKILFALQPEPPRRVHSLFNSNHHDSSLALQPNHHDEFTRSSTRTTTTSCSTHSLFNPNHHDEPLRYDERTRRRHGQYPCMSTRPGRKAGGFYAYKIRRIQPNGPPPPPLRQTQIKLGRAQCPPKRQKQWQRQCRGQVQDWWFWYAVPDATKLRLSFICISNWRGPGWTRAMRLLPVKHQEKFDYEACGGKRGIERVVEYYLGKLGWPIVSIRWGNCNYYTCTERSRRLTVAARTVL
ncbi:hypothetical protein B0H17DRAFT_1148374 [Mycena rosella]|uniref:Uncharacterized protein n=1 Tax=Mycena rosella TaxID=1033263 RepID=A0AAD7CD27_MYCRO|nr:hypothetical protein B0H17DRAFT_1148374 [Mycena rosella]